jgi:NDP-sugar pyrophosphorylase family protein
MNILILAAGEIALDPDSGKYPLCLNEFNGKTLIENILLSCQKIGDVKFLVALRELGIRQYHIDNIVELLAPGSKIFGIQKDTKGAACTALLAVDEIDNDEELLIVNGNELLDVNYLEIVSNFRERKLDAGVVTFSSIHPRYSYVKLNDENFVIEASEKKPISRNATVGFYWFARGREFVSAAQNMIRKDAVVNGLFYICPTLNELVLNQKKIGTYAVDANKYHPLKTERQVMQFETIIDQGRSI